MLDHLRNRFAIDPIPNTRIIKTVSEQMAHWPRHARARRFRCAPFPPVMAALGSAIQ
jgi:hypothetical protein